MARPLPSGIPPLTLRGLRDLIYGSPRACGEQPELFFCPDVAEDEPPAVHAARVAAAREVCASCPVRLACLGFALRTRPTAGVWAGYDADAGELSYFDARGRRPSKAPGQIVAPEVAA
jgi:hypothetical protein